MDIKVKCLKDKITLKFKELNEATIEIKMLKDTIKAQEQQWLNKGNNQAKEKNLQKKKRISTKKRKYFVKKNLK